ncbi:MAG: acyltransferase, partial [Acidobacteria bacterium]
MPSDKFTVGLIQMSATPDPDKNLERAIDKLHQAAARGAQVVCLPELFQTQYFCQREDAALFDLAQPIPGPITNRLAQLAKQLRIVLIVSVFEKRAPGVYHNTAVVLDADGSQRGLYRKMHIPDDPLYYEKYYFTPGDLGFRAFDTSAGKLGTLVCWDQWYPEGARLTALQGAVVLFYPTAIGWHPAEKEQFGAAQHDAWRTIQRAHAIANGVYVAVVNRVGHENGDIRGSAAQGAGL